MLRRRSGVVLVLGEFETLDIDPTGTPTGTTTSPSDASPRRRSRRLATEPHIAQRTMSFMGTKEAQISQRPSSAAPGLRPFFSFYGGKWRDAVKHYPAPEHDTIVEPFAGSAGFSVRYADRQIVLCELDEVIAGVWKYLIKVSPQEIRAIPDVPLDGSVEDLPVSQEAKWLVGLWLNRGASRPRKRPSKWMRDGIRPGSFWGARVRNTIASQVERIRHWRVHNCSYDECPVDGPATWFVDPPYQHAGKHYAHSSDELDFGALAAWCRAREGQVIVCENKGANWLPFSELADVKTTRAGQRSKEVIWTSEGETSKAGDG